MFPQLKVAMRKGGWPEVHIVQAGIAGVPFIYKKLLENLINVYVLNIECSTP